MSTTTVLTVLILCGAAWTVPYWLPPAVVRLREWVFARVNGSEGIPVPGPTVGMDHFERVYADPAADGRSRGAGLSDLFWYWLAPGPQMHQEHLEPGERYRTVAATTRRVLAIRRERADALATAATRRVLDELPADRTSHVRLRDLMMPVWAEVYHELVFDEVATPAARALIVANADDVVTALKCLGPRHMHRRDRLTRHLRDRIEAGTCPVTLPPPFSTQDTAWYLQGAFFNTAIVQMSEAMAHVLLALATHPELQHDADDDALDRVIDETLRVYPLFGVAHRITSAPITLPTGLSLPTGSVLLFNYPAFHRGGAAADGRFAPDRWRTLARGDAHFIPFGVPANRACPARGTAPIMLRAATREVLRRYALTSSASHTRSLPSRGPAYLTPPGHPGPGRLRLAAMRLRDRWADVGRSVRQLVFGTFMVVDARRKRLCTTYFEKAVR
ncbi:cytochrome P450 [Micromonospora sp. NPDC003816]|uniref:cytochrome P450 n=1 Tax=Micromonospora sp. NPDC003816 TaxID=3364224 RepID=UPI00368BD7A6